MKKQNKIVPVIVMLSVFTVWAFENMLPVITIALSFFMYGTMLTAVQLTGAALIISSVTFLVVNDQKG